MTGKRRALPKRIAYGEAGQQYKFSRSGTWKAEHGETLKHLYAVRVKARALHAARHTMEYHHPSLNDEQLLQANMTEAGSAIGPKRTDFINSVDKLLEAQVERQNPNEEIRLVVDLEAKDGSAKCPEGPRLGHRAYTAEDHFKLMVFASGAACPSMERDSPLGTEFYCVSPGGESLRGWAVVVHLKTAVPWVSQPRLANTVSALKHLVKPRTSAGNETQNESAGNEIQVERLCRYIALPPELSVKTFRGGAGNLKVMLNANFFLHMSIYKVPCATPLGPVVSHGLLLQSYRGTLDDLQDLSDLKQSQELVKMTHVLVMVRRCCAFIMESSKFDEWFEQLEQDIRGKVSAVTGHQILKDGRRVSGQSFSKVSMSGFWNQRYARSVVGLQNKMPCPESLRVETGTLCADLVVLLQFEKRSEGKRLFSTLKESEYQENRSSIPSDGMTMSEVQTHLQFLMLDDAINFDGSGSSSLWTSIGDFAEKRSQPSDIVANDAYAFRPSPIHVGFLC